MTTTNTGPWQMPEELKPYEQFFRDLGPFSVEALMNMYGAKCSHRLAAAGEQVTTEALALRKRGAVNPALEEAIDLRAIVCNAQVGLLAALRGARILRAVSRPKIVCLCGSTRFGDAFRDANLRETLAGNIVLTIGCDTRSDEQLLSEVDKAELASVKAALDELHLRKIDEADEVLILNVGGYIGESTANELAYARKHGKVVRFLEQEKEEQCP